MYDYKFRQSDISLRKRRRTWHKALILAIGIALVAGVLYGIIQLGLPWQVGSKAPASDPDIILLPLPPYAEPEEGNSPIEPIPDSN